MSKEIVESLIEVEKLYEEYNKKFKEISTLIIEKKTQIEVIVKGKDEDLRKGKKREQSVIELEGLNHEKLSSEIRELSDNLQTTLSGFTGKVEALAKKTIESDKTLKADFDKALKEYVEAKKDHDKLLVDLKKAIGAKVKARYVVNRIAREIRIIYNKICAVFLKILRLIRKSKHTELTHKINNRLDKATSLRDSTEKLEDRFKRKVTERFSAAEKDFKSICNIIDSIDKVYDLVVEAQKHKKDLAVDTAKLREVKQYATRKIMNPTSKKPLGSQTEKEQTKRKKAENQAKVNTKN